MRTTRVFRIASLGLALSGCMTWHNPKLEPSALIDQRHPNAVRVERQDRSRVTLYKPLISGDSIVGNISRKKTAGVPLSEVSNVQILRVNGGLTGLGIMLLAGAIGLIIAMNSVTVGIAY